jgi:hypothetical protein
MSLIIEKFLNLLVAIYKLEIPSLSPCRINANIDLDLILECEYCDCPMLTGLMPYKWWIGAGSMFSFQFI